MPRTVKVVQIGRKKETFWLMCEDGYVRQFDEGDDGLTLDLDAFEAGVMTKLAEGRHFDSEKGTE